MRSESRRKQLQQQRREDDDEDEKRDGGWEEEGERKLRARAQLRVLHAPSFRASCPVAGACICSDGFGTKF